MVDQHVGKCKTEISQKPVPIDEYIAADLLEWYQYTQYHAPTDWVFATDSNRAGPKRGKQPLWLCKVMGLPHSTDRKKDRHHKAHRLAHVPAHLLKHSSGQRGRFESGAGAAAACLHQNNVGRLRTGAYAHQAGSATQGRPHDPREPQCIAGDRDLDLSY